MPFDGAEFRQFPFSERAACLPTSRPLLFRWFRSLFNGTRGDAQSGTAEDRARAALTMLVEARQLIEARPHWLQRRYEAYGDRYCAVGALRAVGRRLHDPAAQKAAHRLLLAVARGRGFRSVQRMNDRSTHEHVLMAFDEAIAAARQRIAVPAP